MQRRREAVSASADLLDPTARCTEGLLLLHITTSAAGAAACLRAQISLVWGACHPSQAKPFEDALAALHRVSEDRMCIGYGSIHAHGQVLKC